MQDNTTNSTGKLKPGSHLDISETVLLDLIKVAEMLVRIGDTKVFCKELSQAQFNILMILKRYGSDGMSQKEIMENLVSTKGNVSIHMGNLTRMGYVRRKASKADARIQIVKLTTKGRRMLESLEPQYLEQIKDITRSMPQQQLEAAEEFLSCLQEKCQATLNGPASPAN